MILTDNNPDLIACYTAVRDEPAEVVRELKVLARQHEELGSRQYYRVRNERFNPERRALADASGAFAYTPSLAAMFIYLNRTGYNGLFRLNADGKFNVPAGRYPKPRICDAENVHGVAAALRGRNVTLAHRHFDGVLEDAVAEDFLYLDPPYAPSSPTARFTNYTAQGFGPSDQERLRDHVVTLAERGCHVMMSNSTAPEITQLYATHSGVARAGLRCYNVPARRAINSNADRRGNVTEYLITNITRR